MSANISKVLDRIQLRSSRNAYQQIEEVLRNAIIAKEIQPGSQLPVERDLALQLRISRRTVRRALVNLVEDGLVVRRQGHGNFVRDEGPARVVPIALVLPGEKSTSSEYLGQMIQAFVAEGVRLNFEILLRQARNTVGAFRPFAELYLLAETRQKLEQSAQSRLVISVDRRNPSPKVVSVVFDDARGVERSVSELAGLGHKQIGFIDAYHLVNGRSVPHAGTVARKNAFLKAVEEHGVKSWLKPLPLNNEAIREPMREELQRKNRPTGFVASDETVAEGLYLAAADVKLRVPQDVSIVTFRESDVPPRLGVDWTGPSASKLALVNSTLRYVLDRSNGIVREEEPPVRLVETGWESGTTLAAPSLPV